MPGSQRVCNNTDHLERKLALCHLGADVYEYECADVYTVLLLGPGPE